ncbi:MAG: hypothetical protein OEU26_04440, partial [Candidatus Tectomicrobia bacterium]|nr:hypothetical protein [Candidatus Tectomicrobia bacterium]
EPAVRWINEADPYEDDPGITLSTVNQDRTVYLIPEEVADPPDRLDRWLQRHYRDLFEAELEGWYTDPTLWPENLTLQLFREWFDIEFHSVMVDTVGGAIYDEPV